MKQPLRKRIKLFFLLSGLFFSSLVMGQTTLVAGDMAIIGCNKFLTANPFELCIVALRDITSGTTIYITDYPYSNAATGFVNTTNPSEGSIAWTTGVITKGSVFLVQIYAATTTPVVSGLPGSISVIGWNDGVTTSTPVAAGGDNWFIYQGSSPTAPTNFVYGWTNYYVTSTGSANGWLANGTQGATNINTSELPPGLANGTTARSLSWNTANGGSHGDNNVYKGGITGTGPQLATMISTVANWNHSESVTYKLTAASNGTTLNGASPFFTGAFTVSGTLPVNLLSFTAKTNRDDVLITWETADAVNFSHYEIERSDDGAAFASIRRQESTGNTGIRSYDYTDVNVWAADNKLFYRLKMIDLDGSFRYSQVVTLQRNSNKSITAFTVTPNPFTDRITVSLTLNERKDLLMEVVDVSGAVVLTKKAVAEKGISSVVFEHAAHLTKGTYFLRIHASSEKLVQKIVKR